MVINSDNWQNATQAATMSACRLLVTINHAVPGERGFVGRFITNATQ